VHTKRNTTDLQIFIYLFHKVSVTFYLKKIYQTVKGLHKSCPKNKGNWYFTGDYPTLGGLKVLNTSFINWY
jgi:amidophosphoribosyltransferase